LQKCDIYGKLQCGGGNPSFQFNYPINVNVHSGGSFDDLTSSKHIRCPGGSLFTTFSGGSFCSAETVLQSFSSSGILNSITIGSPSGPLTCGVLPSGGVLSFPRITFIAIQGGGLLSGDSYLGGIPPSGDLCSGGCGVYIGPGVQLSTADLDGELDIDITTIEIPVGAGLDLGTKGSKKGFRFKFAIDVDVRGSLAFVGSGGGIFLPGGPGSKSGIKFFDGGSFAGAVVTFIQLVDLVTGVDVGEQVDLAVVLVGPYFLTSGNGTIIISLTGMIEFSSLKTEFSLIFN
jgi:hypothetical protein